MKPENDEQFDFSVSEKLSSDLKSLFEPNTSVPPQIDRAVMDTAFRELLGWPQRRRYICWPAYAAAAAAVVVIALLVSDFAKKTPPQQMDGPVTVKMDMNADGVVDILDAFKLAKQIDSDKANMQWDVNADGVVDRQDVDQVASAAVRLNQEVL